MERLEYLATRVDQLEKRVATLEESQTRDRAAARGKADRDLLASCAKTGDMQTFRGLNKLLRSND